jgi:hypothetical protein
VLVAEFSTGVEQLTPGFGMKVYPNPTREQVLIQIEEDGSVELEFISLDGRTVLQQRSLGPTMTVDVSTLPAGVYTVRVRTAYGTIHHTNLIKY